MIEKIADTLVGKQLEQKRIQESDVAIYRYGYVLMLEVLTNILISVLIGIIFSTLAEVIFFLVIFVPLRSYAGGYHMNRAWKCIIATNVIIAVITLYGKYMPTIPESFLWLALEGIGSVIICSLAPVDTPAKPLDEDEKIVYKRKACQICMAEILLNVVLL
ncbi:MAG: accessory gene regulator B family protein, partial [Lachnospiraceae bacterium]|nr:accessory gene regulator B family protein [Lachnospiraceae bacterium]